MELDCRAPWVATLYCKSDQAIRIAGSLPLVLFLVSMPLMVSFPYFHETFMCLKWRYFMFLCHVWCQAGDNISDEAAIEAARQAQILDTLTALPDRLDTFLGSGGGP